MKRSRALLRRWRGLHDCHDVMLGTRRDFMMRRERLGKKEEMEAEDFVDVPILDAGRR